MIGTIIMKQTIPLIYKTQEEIDKLLETYTVKDIDGIQYLIEYEQEEKQ